MRVLGFSRKWDKLQQPEFTTYRYPRKDWTKGRDWYWGEIVKVVYHPRQEHEVLGTAQIIDRSSTWVSEISDEMAIRDGFPNGFSEMLAWLQKSHREIINPETTRINKLTLKWLDKLNDSVGIRN